MLLTISTTHKPATDLGFLLHKNPDRVHQVDLSFGKAIMVFPDAAEDRCTFALTVHVDPVALVRGKGKTDGLLDQYVNDRPYAASSFLSVAISRALNTATAGRSKERQDLADSPIPLEIAITPLAVRGREGIVEDMFTPLGYQVETETLQLDPVNPDWGDSPYVTLRLKGNVRLADMLNHLYVLIPVLDNSKHYFVDKDEVEKLLNKGGGWLENHPEKDFIVQRSLKRRGALVREALARLAEAEPEEEFDSEKKDESEQALEKPIRLNDQRMIVVAEALAAVGANRVIDLGCGEGRLIRELLRKPQFTEITGVDASLIALERAERRLRVDQMSDRQRGRLNLMHGALTYRDRRLEGYDAAALVEVIEHLDPDRLPALERAMFEFMASPVIIVTTPNREYNALFEGMAEGALRHGDHRFEWTRAEFAVWADRVASTHGYTVEYRPIGEVDEKYGPPTQMAVFTREGAA